jgi:hypothetical protein
MEPAAAGGAADADLGLGESIARDHGHGRNAAHDGGTGQEVSSVYCHHSSPRVVDSLGMTNRIVEKH